VWQALHHELAEEGGLPFSVFGVMADRNAEDARPWIEAAQASYPLVVDTQHRVPELYNMFNVPTLVWIDEDGRIARPNDVAVMNERGAKLVRVEPAAYLDRVRAWVRGDMPALSSEERARELAAERLPTPEEQQARAEFALGQWLWERGRGEAAARHFEHATKLAPADIMIQRGTMRMRGLDPMGPEYGAIAGAIAQRGFRLYRPIRD
jgi:hypothetical protein